MVGAMVSMMACVIIADLKLDCTPAGGVDGADGFGVVTPLRREPIYGIVFIFSDRDRP